MDHILGHKVNFTQVPRDWHHWVRSKSSKQMRYQNKQNHENLHTWNLKYLLLNNLLVKEEIPMEKQKILETGG